MKLTKALALFLILTLFCALVGCEKIDLSGGGKDDTPSTENSNSAASSDGTTLTVKTTLRGSDTFRPEGGSSAVADRILSLISDAEEATGLTVSVEIVAKDSLASDFLRLSRVGEKYADIVQTDAMFLAQNYNLGYFLSLQQAGIAPSETGVLRASDGEAYAFRADGWNHPLPTASFLLFYNEKLITDCGAYTPTELAETGHWNWENFEDLCFDVVTQNPEVKAFATPNASETDLVWAILHSAGATYFGQDKAPTIDTQNAINGFAALNRLISSGCTYAVGSHINDTADPTAKLAFINRRTVFYVGNSAEYFEADANSLTENMGEDLRLTSFPAMKNGVAGAVFTQEDTFMGITAKADLTLCKTLLPYLFPTEEAEARKNECIDSYFQNEADGTAYFDLLKKADTHSALYMGDKYSQVEELFLRIVNGGSPKEILSNLQIIFEASMKG